MIRFGLVAYLLITTTAGSALCCCGIIRTLNAVAAPLAADFDKDPDSHAPRSCCCHHEPTEIPRSTGFTESSEEPSLGERSCPCKKNMSAEVVLFANDGKTGSECERTLALNIHLSLALADPVAHVTPNARAQRNDQPLLPFLTSTDLLNTHHLLRC